MKWTLIALFCNLTEPNKGMCLPGTPPITFDTYKNCMQFAKDETDKIPLDKVSYDYQCIQFSNKI